MRWLLLLALLTILLLASAQASLVKVGAYDTPGYAKSVTLSGSYAYVADGYSGLQVIDISSPTSPFLKGTCNTPGYAHGVAISDNYAYMAAGESDLQIIDINNPVNPSLKCTYSTPGIAYGVALSGGYAYVAAGDSGLHIVDINSPVNPTLKGTYDTSGTANGVALSGSYAYVADGSSGLHIVDINSPVNPTLKGTYDTSGTANGVALSGSYAYVAAGSYGLQIIDIIDPDRLSLKGTYNTQGTANDMVLSGSYAYVADGSSGLQIINISDPASPFLKSTYDTPGTAGGVAQSGGYAYVADGDSGLQILAEGASLLGKAWHDQDCDGLWDSGELGYPNVPARLLDGTGSPIAGKSTTTGSDGSYSFRDLVPGDYYVEFSLPQGCAFSPKNQGTDDSQDSDVNSNGVSEKIISFPGQSHSLDAGIFAAYSISGMKFNDLDGDGTKDTGEGGLDGWKIYNDSNNDGSFQEGEISAITGSHGSYQFQNLPPGDYTLREVQQTGWAQTTPSENLHSVVLTNVNVDSINFGNRGALSISGIKFNDLDGDGTKDTGESCLSGWDIQLKDSSDYLLQTATTSFELGQEGSYEFVNLQPGTYRVYEVQKPGWVRTVPVQEYYSVTLTNSPSGGNIFGNNLLAISGVKFEDLNGNSAKDSDEPGLEGWTIKLKRDGTEVASTLTITGGAYSFAGITPGSYTVEEVSKQCWAQTYPAGNVYIVVVSNTGQVAVTKTDQTSVASTEVNFGNVPTASISGMKFEDLNGNGAKDSGEPGLEGWTIKLKKGITEVASTLTVAGGTYSFSGITSGSYTVEEVVQDGWVQSYPASPGTQTVTLVSGVAGPTDINFGNLRTTSFAGMKFEDLNGNGAKDTDEPGLEGWTIMLKNGITEVASTQTVTGGAYSFTGIIPGTYVVEEVSKQGWAQTYPAGNVYTVVVINADQVTVTKADQTSVTSTEVNFGNVPTASISGMKFEDLNGNGQKDAEEKGLKDWTIRLQSPQITETTTTTGQDGSYQFQNLPPGDYTVGEELQSGWLQTSPAGGSYLVMLTDSDVSERDFGNRKLVEAFLVQITADPQTVLPGQEIIFNITINRQGDILLDSLGAEYTLPKGLKFISSNPSPQSVIENADGTSTLIWTVLAFGSQMAAQTAESQAASANLAGAPSPSTTITVTSQVQPGAPESLTSTIVVTGSTGQAAVAPVIAQTNVKCLKLLSDPVKLNKTSDLKEVWPGTTVRYTITYESLVDIPLTNVVITEHASSDLIFLSANPAPDAGTENVWSIGTLPPLGKGTISVLFQVKNASNLSFESQSFVSGSGFVNSYRRLSTETHASGLKNSVTLTGDQFKPVSTTYYVKLQENEGTILLKKEHGSGEYRNEVVAALQMQNRSIKSISTLQAVYRTTSFALLGDKSIDYDSRVSSLTYTWNRATHASTSQEFRYAKSLEMDQQFLLDQNETIMSMEAEFVGQAHLGVRKKDGEAVKPSPVFESSQDYAGTFRINQSLQDYGSNVRMIRNTTGLGLAASDQRLKKSQRSYEHGFGSYEGEELISTAESFIAKDLFASYDPQYGDGKWKAGIWSKSPGQSFLGQEIAGADYILEETKAEGLNDMSTNLRFQGKARLRAVSESAQREADLDEEYVGQYSLQREVHLGGASRFDRPHLTLNKTGQLVPGTAAADYTITVLNDGNAALGPVYVWDIFPAGTDYLGSSLKPERLQPGYANWSLHYLGIGQSVNIHLRLNVTDSRDELVNVVYASGGYNDQWISAGNMSVMQFGWLSCCPPEMLVEKQARIDAADSRLIWYRILLKNQANVSLVAQVTDRLPTGLQLLNASAQPQVEGPDLVWVTTAIPAGESRFIEYRAQAMRNGKFVNTAMVEAHALDGSGGTSTEASATVTVGEATSYAEGGWRPPEWGLDRSEMICDDEIAGDGASCSCPLVGE